VEFSSKSRVTRLHTHKNVEIHFPLFSNYSRFPRNPTQVCSRKQSFLFLNKQLFLYPSPWCSNYYCNSADFAVVSHTESLQDSSCFHVDVVYGDFYSLYSCAFFYINPFFWCWLDSTPTKTSAIDHYCRSFKIKLAKKKKKIWHKWFMYSKELSHPPMALPEV
jgi:hypothetical protein